MKSYAYAFGASVVVAACASAQDAVEWRVADGGNGHWYQLTHSPGTSWSAAAASALIYATEVNGTAVTAGATRSTVLVAVSAPVGVNLEFTCDGNSYMCNGRSTTNTIITFNA